MFVFGPGNMIVTQNNVTNPTPLNIGYAQKITINDKSTVVSLWGSQRRALVTAGGKIQTEVTVEAARFSLKALAAAYLNTTPTTGGTFPARGEAHTVPASSAYTVTPTPPGGGTFYSDQGVIYSATGLPFTRVSSLTAIGQYTYSAGVYTFYSGDASVAILVNYDYTLASTGESIVAANTTLGASTAVSIDVDTIDPSTNKPGLLTLPNVTFASLDMMNTDLEKFSMPKLTGEAFVNAAGNAWFFNAYDTF